MISNPLSFIYLLNIQSESEKLLSKQLRKDEKRIMREQNKAVEDPENLFNIQKMKQERLVNLNL